MKFLKNVLMVSFFILTACGSPKVPVIQPSRELQRPTEQATVAPVIIPTFTITPTASAIPTSTPTPTETPLPDIGGLSYKGYWLKLTKEFDPNGYQKMKLYYQNGYTLTEIAWFCVRSSNNNSPNGFYFIAIDRPTTYPRAGGGYGKTFFSHNFAWKLSYRNWYLHAAPWNQGVAYGCPTKNTGGCVNMRTDDFNILLNGGSYTNPDTGEVTVVPNIPVGTPFVITESAGDCTYLGQCMQKYECRTGLECFRKYTCQYCPDYATKWEGLVAQNSDLEVIK